MIKATDFANRNDLDAHIKAEIGTDIRTNREATEFISGKREDLKRLMLTDLSTVYGLKVVIEDTPTKDIINTRKNGRKR